MCYDISFRIHIPELADYFPELVFESQLNIDFDGTHIAGHAYGEHPVIYRSREGELRCRLMEWGCIPFYVKDIAAYARQRASMLNARSERVLGDTGSYWHKIRERRCVVPMNGFYEHRAVKGWKKKVPYFIRLKEQNMIFLPGLYSVVSYPDTQTGEVLNKWTFTLLTTRANEVMEKIHNDGDNKGRMPLMLPFEMVEKWLSNDLTAEGYREILDYSLPQEALDYWPVYTIRSLKDRPDNKPKNEYWEWEKLPPLGEANPDAQPQL